jgi:hypothetical protein
MRSARADADCVIFRSTTSAVADFDIVTARRDIYTGLKT